MADHKLITFDEEYRIRVLDAEKYEASKSFRDNCAVFGSRVDTLKDMAQEYSQVLQRAAKSVEAEKLRAIGIRNRVAALREEREANKTEMDSLRAEKHRMLDSLGEEAKSLQLILDEQEAQLARLQGTPTV
jgi:intraflagellar transport protein 20